MIELRDVVPGFYFGKRKGGHKTVMIYVYGIFPFYKINLWDFGIEDKGTPAHNINTKNIDELEFIDKIKEPKED